MNKLSTLPVCSALSGLLLVTTSFNYKHDRVGPTVSHSADCTPDQGIDLDGGGHLDTNLMNFLLHQQ